MLFRSKGIDLEHAFEQLAYMKNQRPEYLELSNLFSEEEKYNLYEKSFIVSNHIITRPQHQKLEKTNGIRVSQILHSEATTPIPNLRDYL